ncbi:MAG: 50S ribosomal protein L11 methyltransferase [Candidatus Kapaibacterium sp.]
MDNEYIAIRIKVMEENYDLVFAALSDFSFTGIEERFDEIVITLNAADWTPGFRESMIYAIRQFAPEAKILSEENIAEKNWNEEWERHVTPIEVNERIAITPDWRIDEVDQDIKIIINPKMSFGTGHHATTRLMARLMEKIVRPGSYWIDAGTGTGALAILAIKLGARKCFAFDNNIWSIRNAKENFEINQVDEKIKLEELDIDEMTLPEADGIAANINTNIIIKALPKFHDALKEKGGDLIVSGVLAYDREELLDVARERGFRMVKCIDEDEWVGCYFKPE